MIQARKIQYMCMSKLSPKELANRAHQFLADGDKKKRHPSSKDTSSFPEGNDYCKLTTPAINMGVAR